MHQFLMLIVLLVFSALTFGAESGSERRNNGERRQPLLVPIGRNEYSDLQYNLNFLEPQFQYPSVGGFNYIPNKQPSFPRSQPPLIFFTGDGSPGQQFLLQQPGAPPGNFLIPQPEGPNIVLRGNPNQQNPLFISGYPKPAQVPPVEKDAEEVPNLAGNHPSTSSFAARRPEKLETLDEPQIPSEANDLAPADKNLSPFPKKVPAPQPRLKPGERFFILNGRPLYSNYPVEPQLHQQYRPSFNPQSDIFYLRQQPQYIPAPQPHHQHYQDLFLRNGVTGEISDVRSLPATAFEHGNFISLNQPEDFRHQSFFLRNAIPSSALVVEPSKNTKSSQSRLAKTIQYIEHPTLIPAGQFLPAYGGEGYYFSDLRNSKEEDDTVVIDAKTQDEAESDAIKQPIKKEEEEGSLSQAQPSAVALAGIGGVASAGPRGTALAGPKGLAVSSPQATAVAGPQTNAEEEKDKKPKPKKEKH